MDDHERRRHLITGLVGDRDRLYLTSPNFRARVDALAELLVPMVAGLASDAKGLDAEYIRNLEILRHLPPSTLADIHGDG